MVLIQPGRFECGNCIPHRVKGQSQEAAQAHDRSTGLLHLVNEGGRGYVDPQVVGREDSVKHVEDLFDLLVGLLDLGLVGRFGAVAAEGGQLQLNAFEPVIADGRIYARGSADDKGQLLMHVNAVEAYLQAKGTLPVNVIFAFEGEEEEGKDK